jgi:DNA-binding transcriptional LysR family regulator
VARFRRAHPGIDVHLSEDGGPRLLGRLERGELHVAVTGVGTGRFTSRTLFPAIAIAVVPARHPLARRRTVDVTYFAEAPILLLRRDFGTRQWFDAACQAERLRPRVLIESAAPQTLLALAAIGYGIAVVPSNVLIASRALRATAVTHRGAVIGGWLAASWDPRRFFPPHAERFVEELARTTGRSYPGRDVIRRAPRLARAPRLRAEA